MIGEQLAHFEIKAKLDEGGASEAWLAYDPSLDRDVVVKILPPSVSEDADRLSRFEREANALASLNHPGIASTYGFYDAGDRCFVATEFVDGEILSERLARPRPFATLADLLGFLRQLAEAIEAAHDNGVVHRDLKPTNVKILADGSVKVLDFGLARMIAEAASAHAPPEAPTAVGGYTDPEMIMKTAPYLSPEQAHGEPASRRSDVWAYGCIMYEAIAGKRAFDAPVATDILARIVEDEPDMSAVRGAVPDYLSDLLERCLDKDARMRLRDVGEVRIAIERHGADAAARPQPVSIRLALWAPWILTIILGAALLISLLRLS